MVRFVAHFDGQYLLPDQPVDLPLGKPLQVVIEELPAPPTVAGPKLAAWLDQLEAEADPIEGPPDWAAQLDHYLYGADRRDAADGAGG